jgi:formylglycine-generating enzyme
MIIFKEVCMKRMLTYFSLFTTLSMVLACQGVTQPPAATEAPATVPVLTVAPILATEPPATEPAVLVPIDLAGPPMEVGSRYMYVDGAIIVAVPGGAFMMGSKYFGDTEHTVTLGDFWIYSAKVTNGQYARCLEAGECTSPDLKNNKSFNIPRDINLPVTGVNYAQGEAYCKFVHARLPTEAEWEKTARGPDGNLFPWGDAAPVCDLLNFNFCKGKATDVTSYPKGVSYYSALDLSGNAREWVADWFSPKYYDEAPAADPLGPELGEKRSVRGSSYQDSADPSISAHRFSLKPVTNLPDLSFRCVVDDPTYYAPYCQTLSLYGADVNGGPTDDVIPLPDDCVQPALSQKSDCPDTSVYITIDPYPLPQGQVPVIVGSCAGGPPTYKCTDSGSVSINPPACNIPEPPGGGQCAPGYDMDAQNNNCTGKGPGVNCPTGFDYDPAAQCCTSANPGAKVYGLCPSGFYQQGNACIPGMSNPPPLQTVSSSFQPQDCTQHGDPGGGTPGACVPVVCSRTDPKCVPKSCP